MMGMADLDNILDQRLSDGVVNHIRDQAAVHFDGVKLHIGEKRKICILGTEIIQAQPQAAGVELIYNGPKFGGFNPTAPLCDFQLQCLCRNIWKTALNGQDGGQSGGMHQRGPGEIHGHRDNSHSGGAPLLRLGKALFQDEEVQFPDGASFLQIFDELRRRNDCAILADPAHQRLGSRKRACAQVDLWLIVDCEPPIVHRTSRCGAVLQSGCRKPIFFRQDSSQMHGGLSLFYKASAGKLTVCPGAANPHLLGIAALEDRPQTAAAGQEYLAGSVGIKNNKLCLSRSEQQCRTEDLFQRMDYIPEHPAP